MFLFFFSSRRRHTRFDCDWSSDVCSSDLAPARAPTPPPVAPWRVIVSAQVAAPAGGTIDIPVQLYRGADPKPGVELLLRGASAIPGGATQDPVAITDWRGVATFHVLAGNTPGAYRLA